MILDHSRQFKIHLVLEKVFLATGCGRSVSRAARWSISISFLKAVISYFSLSLLFFLAQSQLIYAVLIGNCQVRDHAKVYLVPDWIVVLDEIIGKSIFCHVFIGCENTPCLASKVVNWSKRQINLSILLIVRRSIIGLLSHRRAI
jgi:hypothetical protein